MAPLQPDLLSTLTITEQFTNMQSILFEKYVLTSFDESRFLDQLGSMALATEHDHPLIQHQVLCLLEEVREKKKKAEEKITSFIADIAHAHTLPISFYSTTVIRDSLPNTLFCKPGCD